MRKELISFDSHKHYTLAARETMAFDKPTYARIEHCRNAICSYLTQCSKGTDVAVEATGNWYWIVSEIEQAGFRPLLVHPRKAKLMMGMINKTDKLDAHGLNRLQRNKTLPTVWIPPCELRDLRELTRTRIILVRQRTRLKNRISATLNKYGLVIRGVSDPFGNKARSTMKQTLSLLPEQTRFTTQQLLSQLDFITTQIEELEKRLNLLVKVTPEMSLLMTSPGIGMILAATIVLEIGEIGRFASAERLASYSGTTPRVHASGDKVRYGRLRPDVNRTLKWAYAEAANSIAVNHKRSPDRHVSCLYRKIRHKRNHSIAVGAVARHLAEATYYMLSKNESYQEPSRSRVVLQESQTR